MDFPSLADLEVSLTEVGLRTELDDVVRDARPGIRFLRGKIQDGRLLPGASKLGGFPDLPDSIPWPMGDPFPDAAQQAAYLDEFHASRQSYGSPNPEWERNQGDVLIMRKAALFQPFPLAFAGQLNLQALSAQDGFDPVLPKQGLLSFFVDLRNQGHASIRVLWLDQPDATLRRRPHPQALVDYYNRENAIGGSPTMSGHAEALYPYSVLTINKDRPPSRAYQDEFEDWLEFEPRSPPPELPVDPSTEQTGRFLDHFCGWPYQIQDDPCNGMEGGPAQWQSLFTWTKESHGGCFMSAQLAGDALCYVIIPKNDLAAANFSGARIVVTD